MLAPASRILRISSFGTGSGFNRRIERVVLMSSNRSAVFGAVLGVACSVINPLGWQIAALRIDYLTNGAFGASQRGCETARISARA